MPNFPAASTPSNPNTFYPSYYQHIQAAQLRISRMLSFISHMFSPDVDQTALEAELRSFPDAEVGYITKLIQQIASNPKMLQEATAQYMSASNELQRYLSQHAANNNASLLDQG